MADAPNEPRLATPSSIELGDALGGYAVAVLYNDLESRGKGNEFLQRLSASGLHLDRNFIRNTKNRYGHDAYGKIELAFLETLGTKNPYELRRASRGIIELGKSILILAARAVGSPEMIIRYSGRLNEGVNRGQGISPVMLSPTEALVYHAIASPANPGERYLGQDEGGAGYLEDSPRLWNMPRSNLYFLCRALGLDKYFDESQKQHANYAYLKKHGLNAVRDENVFRINGKKVAEKVEFSEPIKKLAEMEGKEMRDPVSFLRERFVQKGKEDEEIFRRLESELSKCEPFLIIEEIKDEMGRVMLKPGSYAGTGFTVYHISDIPQLSFSQRIRALNPFSNFFAARSAMMSEMEEKRELLRSLEERARTAIDALRAAESARDAEKEQRLRAEQREAQINSLLRFFRHEIIGKGSSIQIELGEAIRNYKRLMGNKSSVTEQEIQEAYRGIRCAEGLIELLIDTSRNIETVNEGGDGKQIREECDLIAIIRKQLSLTVESHALQVERYNSGKTGEDRKQVPAYALLVEGNPIEEGLELPFSGFPHSLELMLSNLGRNSLEAGAASILINLSLDEEHGTEFYVVDYQDDGAGMSQEQIQNYLDSRLKGQHGSSLGIGHQMINGAIKKHRGSLEIAGTEPKGTRFKIRLPTREE